MHDNRRQIASIIDVRDVYFLKFRVRVEKLQTAAEKHTVTLLRKRYKHGHIMQSE